MRPRSRLKVAHLTSVHRASDTRIAYRECATLAEAGYEVVLVAAGDVSGTLPGVRLHAVPAPRNRFERVTRTVWRVFQAALAERAAVYHFHDPELMGVGLALRALGARVVFDVHEDIPSDIADKPWIPQVLRRPIAAVSALALHLINTWFSAIVAATPAIARRFPHARMVVVCNYPRIEEFPVPSATDFSRRDPAAIYIGSITQLRCVEELVQALSAGGLPSNGKLILGGTFESQQLERRTRAMPGWKHVDYVGFCTRAEVAKALSRARVGMLLFRPAANHDEAMPTKLFEYLGAGLPVIISDTLQCSSIVKDNECGLVVDPSDVQAIARAITFFIQNPAIAQAMGERGRRLVTERYQWKSEATKLTKLYAEIA